MLWSRWPSVSLERALKVSNIVVSQQITLRRRRGPAHDMAGDLALIQRLLDAGADPTAVGGDAAGLDGAD
jgi:hypothetical protein